ncbi:MAG TPA: hypothetical protein VMC84_07305 [Methanocella sp.]|uniref:hypothetical protein n=1 Tax=Methanocella sp. TaxID=2052833 RepID=UPI002CFD1773|nr:hypothetical protein [Methanocella sp.]HTY90967.1 hypothetical protein [Methanocella sp.]
MRTQVDTHGDVNIYRVDARGQTFYKTDPVFGEPIHGKTVDEVKKSIDAKKAAGDTRAEVMVHEGKKIFRVTDGGKVHFISEPLFGEVIVGDTPHDVALGITRRHAILGLERR